MPLHPLGIAVLGTLAVVGTGVAIKKFVYDPHLAPVIEAYIAQLRAEHEARAGNRRAIPVSVPVPVAGPVTSAHPQQEYYQRLPKEDDRHRYELQDDPKWSKEDRSIASRATGRELGYGNSYEDGQGGIGNPSASGGLRMRRRSHRSGGSEQWDQSHTGDVELRDVERQRLIGGASDATEGGGFNLYPLTRASPAYAPVPAPRRSASGRSTPSHRPTDTQLIDLSHSHSKAQAPDQGVSSPQDLEIRSVIFNQPSPSPSPSVSVSVSGASTPSSARRAHLDRRVVDEHLSALGGVATLRPAMAYPLVLPDLPSAPLREGEGDVEVEMEGNDPFRDPQYQYNDNYPHHNSNNTFHNDNNDAHTRSHAAQPSTTFSFLSLSQVSSPEVPTSMLASWSALSPPSKARDHSNLPLSPSSSSRGPAPAHDRHSAEVMSLPDDALSSSSYADVEADLEGGAEAEMEVESYTPYSPRSGAQSPTYGLGSGSGTDFPPFPSFPSVPTGGFSTGEGGSGAGSAAAAGAGTGAGELGLTFINSPPGGTGRLSIAALRAAEEPEPFEHVDSAPASGFSPGSGSGSGPGPASTSASAPQPVPHRRGPMSVISVSDSDADKSEWEAV